MHLTVTPRAIAALAVILPVASAAAQSIAYESQARTVRARASEGTLAGNSQSFDAPDFGPWDQPAMASYVVTGGSAGASVRQTSTLGPREINAQGNVSTSAGSSQGRPVFGEGSTLFDVTFSVSGAWPYLFQGATTDAEWALTGPGVNHSGVGGPFVFQGTLEPGEYRLRLAASARATPGAPDGAGFSVLFRVTPSCRADLNSDGELTFDDIQLFVGFYNGADPRADVNSDGEWTFDDIQLFVGLYNAGC
jgi:hypothetical protein